MVVEVKEKIRVVLADDHAVVRKGIREFLEEAGDIQVVGEAANGQEAMKLVAELQPDVAVLDIRMPAITGIEATRRHWVRSIGLFVNSAIMLHGIREQIYRKGTDAAITTTPLSYVQLE